MAQNRRIYPPVYFFGFLLLMLGLDWFFPRPTVFPKPYNALGVLAFVLGIAIVFWVNWRFLRAETTIKPFKESLALVTDGLFRYSRNPVYVGMTLGLAGIAAGLGSLAPWFALPPFAIIIDRGFVRHEEAMLRAKFGTQYDDYCRRVRRWL